MGTCARSCAIMCVCVPLLHSAFECRASCTSSLSGVFSILGLDVLQMHPTPSVRHTRKLHLPPEQEQTAVQGVDQSCELVVATHLLNSKRRDQAILAANFNTKEYWQESWRREPCPSHPPYRRQNCLNPWEPSRPHRASGRARAPCEDPLWRTAGRARDLECEASCPSVRDGRGCRR